LEVHIRRVKVKLSLCFFFELTTAPWRRNGEWRYSSTHPLISALDGGEWSASRPAPFTPRERAPGTHWIGGWVGPRACLVSVVKRKILSPRRGSNPRTPIVQLLAQRYTDWANAALILEWIIGKQGGKVRIGCIWLRIGASGELLWTR
jgi:hypothetical protein